MLCLQQAKICYIFGYFFQLWKPMDSQPVRSRRHCYWPALAKPWFPFTQPIYPPFPIFLSLWCLCRIGKASAQWAATPRIRRHASNVVRLYNNRPPIVASTNAFPDRRAVPAYQRSLRSHLFLYIDWVLPNTLRSKLSIVPSEHGWGNVLIMVAKVVKIQDNLLIECWFLPTDQGTWPLYPTYIVPS